MKEWRLSNIKYISEASILSDNSGQIPKKAKYQLTFINIITGYMSFSSDIIQKRTKRNKIIDCFQNTYSKLYFERKSVSIFSCVVSQEQYNSPSKFIQAFKRKFARKGIQVLGYIWVRDIGDIKFDLHYHFLIATERIGSDIFKELFSSKKKRAYEVQFLRTRTGMSRYLQKKELYGKKKQRSTGMSRKFITIKQSLLTNSKPQ